MIKYYSVLRPIGLGTFPASAKIEYIVNFDERRRCEDIGRGAWGYMVLSEPLTEREVRDYELVYGGEEP